MLWFGSRKITGNIKMLICTLLNDYKTATCIFIAILLILWILHNFIYFPVRLYFRYNSMTIRLEVMKKCSYLWVWTDNNRNKNWNMRRSIYGWMLEVLTILCLVCSFYPFCFYNKFTEPIPIHYNALGQVDALGDRSFFWLLPLLSFVFYIGMSISERYYSKFNYPVKVTEANANSLYKLVLGLLRHIKFITIILFTYINNATMYVALSKENGLNGYILAGLLTGLMIVLFSYIVRMMRIKN